MPKRGTHKFQNYSDVMDFAVEDPELPPFKPVLQSIVKMAFTAGLQALESRGLTMEAIKTDRRALHNFLRGCHRGYDKAQQRIGSKVIALQKQIEKAEADAVELRKSKDPSANLIQFQIVVLRNRQIALRRIIDSILHAIVYPDTWILRRFIIDDRVHGIDSPVLQRMLFAATDRNQKNRLRFCLVSDLSTIVQVGDLVEKSFISGEQGWKVIELKEGKVNEVLLEKLDKANEGETHIDSQVSKTMGPRAAKQLSRIRRQLHRMSEVERIMATDIGSDPGTGTPIRMTPDRYVTDNFLDAIRRVCELARKKGFGCASIAGGVHLIGLQRNQAVGQYLGAVSHTFFHMRHPCRPCGLAQGGEGAEQEIREMKSGPAFLNLVANSMQSQWGTPVYLWLGGEREETLELVMGDILIFAQFDASEFFAFAGDQGVKLSWVTGKRAESLKKMKVSYRIPGSPNAWGIDAIFEGGTKQTYLSGFLARVFSDLTTPQDLLTMIKRDPEQMRKMEINKQDLN